jgi:DNA-directed RNA polymerase specialized sigma24 family protein
MPGKYSPPGRHAGPMVRTAISDPLGGLARRVARGDRSALAGLHDTLAPEVLRATFVEVWRMARYHTSDGSVRGWATSDADRRAAEHARGSSLELDRLLDIPEGRDILSASSGQ